jgi:hypothetical protein
MRKWFSMIVDLAPTPGGRLIVALIVFMAGVIADALRLDVGRDIVVAGLGAVTVLIHQRLRRRRNPRRQG